MIYALFALLDAPLAPVRLTVKRALHLFNSMIQLVSMDVSKDVQPVAYFIPIVPLAFSSILLAPIMHAFLYAMLPTVLIALCLIHATNAVHLIHSHLITLNVIHVI